MLSFYIKFWTERQMGTGKTRAITERDHFPPPAHCLRAGYAHRMENGLVRIAPDKIVSMDRWTDGQTDMKTAYAQLHIQTNMSKFQRSTCKNVGVKLWITMI